MRIEMEDPYLLIYEKKLPALNELLPLLESVVQTGKPLLINCGRHRRRSVSHAWVNKLRGGAQSGGGQGSWVW
jgi:chaperonin GroEL